MARRRQRSIDDAEAQKELRLQGKVVPTLDPIDSSLLSGPSDLHLTDNEIEVQHRWAKLEELKKDQEARRVRTKQDVLDDTNDAVHKGRRSSLQALEEDGGIDVKEGKDYHESWDSPERTPLITGADLANPQTAFCLVLVLLCVIMLVITENSCQKRGVSLFRGTCFGGDEPGDGDGASGGQ